MGEARWEWTKIKSEKLKVKSGNDKGKLRYHSLPLRAGTPNSFLDFDLSFCILHFGFYIPGWRPAPAFLLSPL